MSRSRKIFRQPVVLVLAFIGFLSIPPARSQQVSIPDTPAGHVLAAWLDAFNSGDRARMSAYRETYEPAAAQPLDGLMRSAANTMRSRMATSSRPCSRRSYKR